MFDLSGRVALVTGASGGIGGAIAKTFVAAGAKVAVSGTRVAALDSLCQELGEAARPFPCDLGNPEETDALVKRIETEFGQLDVLVNNAGLTRDNLMMRMKDDEWQTVLDVNLSAAFRLARASLRGMMKRRWGRIIGITSVVGATGNPGQANYAAAKAGMVGFSKSLALEVASRGVTVNCIAPGMIETAMTEALNDEQRGAILQRIPAGQIGKSEDVAAAALYLAASEASYVTGQTLHVNGGMAMI